MKSILRANIYYFFISFFLLSFLQTTGYDLRLIPVIKICVPVYVLSCCWPKYKVAIKTGGAFRSANILLLAFCLYFFFSAIGYIWNGKPIRYFVWGVVLYIFPITFMFWSILLNESQEKKVYKIIEMSLIMWAVVGLYFYYFSPSWYVSWRTNGGDEDLTNMLYSYKNLSSVSMHPYFVGYNMLFLLSVSLFNIYHGIKKNRYWCIFMISLLCLVLAQQRVSLLWFVVFATIYLFKGMQNGKKDFHLLFVVCFLSIFVLIYNYWNEIDFLINRYTSIFNGEILDDGRRDVPIKLFSKGFNWISGEGGNSVGHIALQDTLKNPCIADAEFMKFIYELGALGTCFFYGFTAVTIWAAFKAKSYVELPLVVFFVVATFGANPFEKDNIIIIYWICAGRVWNHYRKQVEKKEIKTYNI